jgi:3-hydroxyacyl-CoA dehydrogenase
VRKLGVLGSGLMGHGISYVAALSGIEVVMTDSTIENAKKGLERIKTILEGGIKRGLISEEKMTKVLDLIIVTDDYDKLDGCDLIIEAVFEDRALKGKVTGVAEKKMDSSGVFASNTSTIPITKLAENSIRPEKFIGIHFFSPVHKMKLVEIIKGEKTSTETLAKAFDFVLRIRKIPIVVNDSRGFYTTRVFERYPLEGMVLLAEGNSAESIESAGQKAGMPVGPLAVIDEINIRQSVHKGMHNAIRDIFSTNQQGIAPTNTFLLIDGNDFRPYSTFNQDTDELNVVAHQTIEGGDNKYTAIAAASILAKVARDEYISNLCSEYPELATRYGIDTNQGYGTKTHMNGILEYGITQWHRKSYGKCKTAPMNELHAKGT